MAGPFHMRFAAVPLAGIISGRRLMMGVEVGSIAPDIGGQDAAMPIGAIACVAMTFERSLGRADLARRITTAVDHTLAAGDRTRNLCGAGGIPVGTEEFGRQVLERLK